MFFPVQCLQCKVGNVFAMKYELLLMLVTIVGECLSRFTSKKVPYCVKFHPEDDKQHLFVAGTSDKKIVCVSIQLDSIENILRVV